MTGGLSALGVVEGNSRGGRFGMVLGGAGVATWGRGLVKSGMGLRREQFYAPGK